MSRFPFRRWTFSVGRSTFGFLRFMESGHVIFDAHWDHEPYSGRDGAPPPPAQRHGTDGGLGRTAASQTRTAAERRPYLDGVQGTENYAFPRRASLLAGAISPSFG